MADEARLRKDPEMIALQARMDVAKKALADCMGMDLTIKDPLLCELKAMSNYASIDQTNLVRLTCEANALMEEYRQLRARLVASYG
jgi:hypothetical protein